MYLKRRYTPKNLTLKHALRRTELETQFYFNLKKKNLSKMYCSQFFDTGILKLYVIN